MIIAKTRTGYDRCEIEIPGYMLAKCSKAFEDEYGISQEFNPFISHFYSINEEIANGYFITDPLIAGRKIELLYTTRNPKIFVTFEEWLYSGEIKLPYEDGQDQDRIALDVYLFAIDYQLDEMRNAALTELFLIIEEQAPAIPWDLILDVYNSRGIDAQDSLRYMLAILVLETVSKDEENKYAWQLPKGYFQDMLHVARESHKVPYTELVSVKDWCRIYRQTICPKFHKHANLELPTLRIKEEEEEEEMKVD